MGFPDLNQDLLRAVIMVGLIIAFLGMWAWAWSSKRKEVFHEASMLPLEEDDGTIPQAGDEQNTARTAKTRNVGTEE